MLGSWFKLLLVFQILKLSYPFGEEILKLSFIERKKYNRQGSSSYVNVHIVVDVLQCPVPQPLPSAWKWSVSVSSSVVSNSLQAYGSYPTRLLCPWDSPGKNTGAGCHFLLQGIFPTQKLNSGLLDCRQILYHLIYQRSPQIPEPNNDRAVKDQLDSPSLSSGGLLAARVKPSP